ncbi:MAG TPA: hypothetical protein VHY19_07410 [Steroidobacteraceae bacterium]|nr:hypothetical protein [Steroidobacteraceae bacterium]
MALYKHNQYLDDSDHRAFDVLHLPESNTPNSGIYRCEVCGAEVVSEKAKRLPPKNHQVHAEDLRGPIQWRLIVLAESYGGLGITAEIISTPARSPGRELAFDVDDDEQR